MSQENKNKRSGFGFGELRSAMLNPILRLSVLFMLHIVLFSGIYVFSFLARYNFELPADRLEFLKATLGPVVATKMLVFYFFDHFHGWWRYVTFADLRSLLKVSVLSLVAVAFMDYFLLPLDGQIPRLSLVLDMMCTILIVGGLRSIWRFADETAGARRSSASPSLLVGSDYLAGQLASQINSNQAMRHRVVGLISNSPNYRRRAILGGIEVLGRLEDLSTIAEKIGIKEVLVPAGSLDGITLRRTIEKCNSMGIRFQILPRFEDAMSGTEKIPLRPLDINDLLKREPVQLDTTEVRNLVSGKRVLVTGAGGSIGSEICRQVLVFQPSELVLLGRGENRIYEIHNELDQPAKDAGVVLHQEIGDITDELRMANMYRNRRPEIVFHAAAHKHVPLMEMHPGEAVKNNVLGTKVIATLADQHGVSYFVMVSSDKAVNPTSIMGATKQIAERVVYDLAQTSKTKFATVRFGNVLGSAGSVIPRFQQQIRNGGPITITDARMTRYFMSIPEAAQLVVQSASMCNGGEIYVLDMGDPVRIVQLAEDLVTLSGLPHGSIEFYFTGIRPGEKLYEELYFDDETTLPTRHPKIRAAYPREFQDPDGSGRISLLIDLADKDPSVILAQIANIVDSYRATTVGDEEIETKDVVVRR